MPTRTKVAAPLRKVVVRSDEVSYRSVAPAGTTTTVARALRNEGVICNGQEEKGCQAHRQEIREEEGRQIGREVDRKEVGRQTIAEEESLNNQDASYQAGCIGSGTSPHASEPRGLKLGDEC